MLFLEFKKKKTVVVLSAVEAIILPVLFAFLPVLFVVGAIFLPTFVAVPQTSVAAVEYVPQSSVDYQVVPSSSEQ